MQESAAYFIRCNNVNRLKRLQLDTKNDIDALHRYAGRDEFVPCSLTHIACYFNANECVEYLLDVKGANVNVIDGASESLLKDAVANRNLSLIGILLDHNIDCTLVNDLGQQAVHFAAMGCDVEVMQMLLENEEVSVVAKDNKGWTPLMWALDASKSMDQVLGMAKLLHANGADLNSRDDNGNTVLHWACENMMPYMVKWLLWNNADATLLNYESKSPMDVVCDAKGVKNSLIKKMLQFSGADTGVKMHIRRPPSKSFCEVCYNSPEDLVTEPNIQCSSCDIQVHRQCYDVSETSNSKTWRCDFCAKSVVSMEKRKCILCPVRGGAFKLTDDNRWVHVRCSVFFGPTERPLSSKRRSVVKYVTRIHQDHYRITCRICNISEGACVECYYGKCKFAFHPLCARSIGLREEYCPGAKAVSYCISHHFHDMRPEMAALLTPTPSKKRARSNTRVSAAGGGGSGGGTQNKRSTKRKVQKLAVDPIEWTEREHELLFLGMSRYQGNLKALRGDDFIMNELHNRPVEHLKMKWEELQKQSTRVESGNEDDTVGAKKRHPCTLCTISGYECEGESLPCGRCKEYDRIMWCREPNFSGAVHEASTRPSPSGLHKMECESAVSNNNGSLNAMWATKSPIILHHQQATNDNGDE